MAENIDEMRKIPCHVAIIMDGNGRWAKARNKERAFGHRAGSENVIKVVEAACDLGIKYITLYAFSTENWKRPQSEKKALFSLLNEFYKKEIKRLIKNNILIKHIGDIALFPKKTQDIIAAAEAETLVKCSDPIITVILALNYGSFDELRRGLISFSHDIKNNILDIDNINNETIFNYLDTKDVPSPDLLIRTSGECRLSNFLLLQIAYSELYFTNTLWPDFSKEEFSKSITSYMKRDRRYGGIDL